MNMHSKNSLGILKFKAIWKSKNITHFGAGGGLVTKLCPPLATHGLGTYQAPLSMRFARQEYWSGLTFPSPGDLTDTGIEPQSPALSDSLRYSN